MVIPDFVPQVHKSYISLIIKAHRCFVWVKINIWLKVADQK
jgi:hypothetical protein